MDIGSQKGSIDMNVPKIINLLLEQQHSDKLRHEDRYYPFVSKHEKTRTFPLNPLNRGVKSYKFNYVKARRAVYDHARSLRYYEKGFSINTVLSFQKENPLKFTSPLKSKTTLKIREKFKDILKKTNLVINTKSKENCEKNECKSERKQKPVLRKENKILKRFKIEIPTIRAQTIVPCPRRKKNLSMVDAEITTDNTFSLYYN